MYRIAREEGLWQRDTGSEGAHYIEAQYNPFKKEGIRCDACIFYDDGHCDIVQGDIEPGAFCKLWVIPERELNK